MQFLEYRCFTVYCSQIDLQRGLPPGLGIERKGDESGQKEHPAYRREDVQPRFERSVLPDGHGEFGRSVPDDRRVERDFDPVEKAGIVARNRSCDPGRAVAETGAVKFSVSGAAFLYFFARAERPGFAFLPVRSMSYILKQSGQSLSIRSIFAVFGSTGGKLSEKSCRPVSGM